MDGEHYPCPVVENKAARVNLADNDYLLVTASHDSVQMFPDPRFTHLRYYDGDDNTLKALWLPEEVLADLMDFGIPVTIRESITEDEFNCWTEWMGRCAMIGFDTEIDQILE